jgi:hypothetical protein
MGPLYQPQMIYESNGAFGGVRIDRRNQSTEENPA